MRILAIYDNDGKTFDRYTIITDVVDHSGQYHDALGTSGERGDIGYSQWGTVLKTPDRFNFTNKQWRTRCDLGKRVTFESLPAHLQQHLAIRLWGDE